MTLKSNITVPPRAANVTLFLFILVWSAWLMLLGPSTAFDIVGDNWQVTLTMIFGSFIAGATSEGGGAVAFPVFTKLLNVDPTDAKVFSLAIQSIGMTAASLVILALRIRIEWRIITWVSLGGILGMILGTVLLAPMLSSAAIKMAFTVMVSSFAVTLYALNRGIRLYNTRLPQCGWRERRWMLMAGVVGGIMSGLVGNGIDILAFSLMVLLFRISEKIATPTSVILMALNAIFGFSLHYFYLGTFNPTVLDYWLAAVPVVVVGAPLGAIICSFMTRELIVRMLLSLIALEFISSIILIPLTLNVLLSSLAIAIVFSLVYIWMYRSQSYEPVGN